MSEILMNIWIVIIAAVPSIMAIISSIIIKKVLCGRFDNLGESVLKMKHTAELQKELTIANAENRALKKQISELLTKIDHVNREE